MFERLLYLREENEITQTELGKIFKVDRSVISKWENGTITIPLNQLNNYANYFNVSLDYLTNLSNIRKKQNTNKELNKIKIGKNLKQIRKENNLTLRTLAKQLNTTSSTISAYESGKTLILTAFAYQIAKRYNISMDWLVGKSNNKNIKENLTHQ